jgi:hypothetical protein
MAQRNYKGKAVETGKTAMGTKKASPAIRMLVKRGHIKPGMRVLDYGAGNGRNAEYLRSLGCKVYAYDPFNGDGKVGGFKGVSTRKPKGRYDVAFTSFVLNVVPIKDEREIMKDVARFSDVVFHVVRGRDELMSLVDGAFPEEGSGKKGNIWIRGWFRGKYLRLPETAPDPTRETAQDVAEPFCEYGFQTGHGKFQRLVKRTCMVRRGYSDLHSTKSYTVYCSSRGLL